MSGWIFIGESESRETRLSAFRQRFDVAGVQSLNLRQVCNRPTAAVHSWMWRDDPDWADFDFAENTSAGVSLLLDGYITGTGRFAERNEEQESAAGLLELWLQHGRQLLPELNGSFAITVIDHNAGNVTVITDRWGSRPVWYGFDGKCLLLGNFTSAVAALFQGSLKFSKAGIWSLLAGQRPVADRSIYANINRVGAGRITGFSGDRQTFSDRWYELEYRPDKSRSAADWGVDIADALKSSAASIRSARQTNLLLSGGLDSRIAAAALGEGTRTTTIISQANLSSEVAERVAQAIGSQHETLIRDDNWYLASIEAAALMSGGNYNMHHAHFFQAVARVSPTPNEAFLLGDLAENFNTHYCQLGAAELRDLTPDKVPGYYTSMDKYTHKNPANLQELFRPGLAAEIQAGWLPFFEQQVKDSFAVGNNPLDAMDSLFRWSDNYYCPTNLMLECLRPVAGHANLMFDNALFDLIQRVPADLKSRSVLHKKVLRNLDSRLLWIPNSNFWLPPGFPNWAEQANMYLRRRVRPLIKGIRGGLKRSRTPSDSPRMSSPGSWHVMYQWYSHDPAHRELIGGLIGDAEALPAEIFNRQGLQQSLNEFWAGDLSRQYELYALMSLGLLNRLVPAAGLED